MGAELHSFFFYRKKLPNMQVELHDSHYLLPKSYPFSSGEAFN